MPSDDGFLDTYLPYLLRRADQALSSPFYEVLTRYGVARSEWRVIAVLHELGELSVVDLAAAALSPQPTVTHALRRLEERGLVQRTLGTADKRQRFISLTPAGTKLTTTLIAEARAIEADALGDSGDLAELAAQLRAVIAAFEARAATAEAEAARAS